MTIFTGRTGSGKTHLVLELIENYYNKHFDYIENDTYHTKECIIFDDKVWLVEP